MKPASVRLPALLPPLVADLAAVIALFTVFPILAPRLAEPRGANALLLSAGFLAFCAGVFALRRLQPARGGEREWATRNSRAILAVIFALAMTTAIAWQLGFFRSGLQVDTRDLGEGGSASYFVFGPGAWLGFAMVYVLVLAFNVRQSVQAHTGRWAVSAGLGLLATNAMLLLLSAQAAAMIGSGGLWLPVLYTGLLLLFVPPRLIFIDRATDFPSPMAYILLGLFLLVAGAYALGIITL